MIPTVEDDLLDDELELEIENSKNYKMDIGHEVVNGYSDKLEAMKQVIYKILNTERYQHIVYSWDYGIELLDLIGEPVTYVCPELERRITEALVQDDRIDSVENFDFDILKKRTVKATFTVHTIFGNVEEEMVVNF